MMAKRQKSPAPAPPAPDSGAPADTGTGTGKGRFLRPFLMIAGGLAAPCLALAAFLLTNGGSDAAAKVPPLPRVTATTRPAAGTPSVAAPAPATTTSTTAPAVVSAAGLRDPFAPLVK